ncbi:hypothetical protein EJ05DRAFT_507495 [Pseudovirgaria hyperparasitica]|uniref:G-patch domain-containing protein n=1 Tax=Pseudovirgaria hyperparasitica TaxID=470096 RepID=A0A6A6WI15_9PEZI|nr:uncharacterized protein EJ05DRAFT_507495 [Pseudovirgaria hyperparasitica]KAF2761879.1 hypothetical protein EJ05DRAFT_507495 [Pseudovirgaria hyperparasitica]
MADSDEEFYTIPIKDQRVFGAGIKRKRVAFVRASTAASTTTSPNTSNTTPTLAEQYLAKHAQKNTQASQLAAAAAATADDGDDDNDNITPAQPPPLPKCEICKHPIRTHTPTSPSNGNNTHNNTKQTVSIPHEATIPHQLALAHSHPPSSIDRTSRGLPYMQARGWDPDARQGLGATGSGMLYPIEAVEKRNRFGIGVRVKKKQVLAEGEDKEGKKAERERERIMKKKLVNLDAKQIRRLDDEERRVADRMRELFYRDESVDKLLGAMNEAPSLSVVKTAKMKSNVKRMRRQVSGFEGFDQKGRWI